MNHGALAALAAAAPTTTGFDMLRDLAVIMCVAAVTTVLFQRIKQPVVLGYLLAGLIVGPHLPVPLFADETLAHQMSELGVILLMFSLGLEFSLRKVVRVGPTAGLVAIIECSLMIWLGYSAGRLFGWSRYESLFCGALVAISSTTVVVKAFAERGIKGKITEIVYGILIVEDLIAIVLLALLTPIASRAGLSAERLVLTLGRLGAFLVGTLVVGVFLVPRLVRLIVRLRRAETTVVACVGICFAFALLARALGYSVALGAFLAGALVAESGAAATIERAIEPVRDVFAAVFFVSVGMLIDPVLIAQNWVAVIVLTLVVVVGKVAGVTFGAFLAGNTVRLSVQAGMSLAQIGEFSFIIAGVGLSLGVVGHFLYPVAVAVSALTTLATPWLIRASGRAASYADRRLPHPMQTFVTLYGSWVQHLRSAPATRTSWARVRRMVGLLLVDLVAVASVIIGTSITMDRIVGWAGGRLGIDVSLARLLVIGAAVAVVGPFLLGAVRVARALGVALAAEALPGGEAGLDLAAAPRRALLVTFQLAILLVAGIPLVAVTQPFLASFPGAAALLVAIVALALPLWRSATNLHGHVRAGAEVLLEALARQTHDPGAPAAAAAPEEVKRLMPGLGEALAISIAAEAPCVGQTLKQIGLRGLTGASVIAIERGPDDLVYPTAEEAIRAGDVLVVTGSKDAVASARLLLEGERRAAEG